LGPAGARKLKKREEGGKEGKKKEKRKEGRGEEEAAKN